MKWFITIFFEETKMPVKAKKHSIFESCVVPNEGVSFISFMVWFVKQAMLFEPGRNR